MLPRILLSGILVFYNIPVFSESIAKALVFKPLYSRKAYTGIGYLYQKKENTR